MNTPTPQKILIFAAHQDDETIGCGGALKKWSLSGSEVHVVFMTNGNTGIDRTKNIDKKNVADVRMAEAKKATKILGVKKIKTLNIPCQTVSNNQKTFHKVIKQIREIRPHLVLTHSEFDKHRDHRITATLVKEACWKARENIHPELGRAWHVGDLWAYEISDLLPRVDFVVDITETFNHKKKAYKKYFSQHNIIGGMWEHIDGLTKVRGYMVGTKRGEAFMRVSSTPILI